VLVDLQFVLMEFDGYLLKVCFKTKMYLAIAPMSEAIQLVRGSLH
jgi:hypothetical protein